MAVQMHVAHSSIMRGVGVIAGVTYDCANSRLPSSSQRLAQGLMCLDGSVDYAPDSIARTAVAAGVPGAIDDPAANLPHQKVWLFSGYNDGSVRRGAMNAVDKYYQNYVKAGNVFYQTDNHAPHALITNDYGGPCLDVNVKYINNCDYDAAGQLLQHIYGGLNPPSGSGLSGSIQAFDQREFVAGGNPKSIGLADTGYIYVPNACSSTTPCRVHVVFHGCKQYAGKVGDAVYKHGGYSRPPHLRPIQRDVLTGGVSAILFPRAISREKPGTKSRRLRRCSIASPKDSSQVRVLPISSKHLNCSRWRTVHRTPWH